MQEEDQFRTARAMVDAMYAKSGGRPTIGLRRVYNAYLDNERRRYSSAGVLTRLDTTASTNGERDAT